MEAMALCMGEVVGLAVALLPTFSKATTRLTLLIRVSGGMERSTLKEAREARPQTISCRGEMANLVPPARPSALEALLESSVSLAPSVALSMISAMVFACHALTNPKTHFTTRLHQARASATMNVLKASSQWTSTRLAWTH